MTNSLRTTDSIEQLYGQVTAAIMRAEKAEAVGDSAQAASAYLDVSFCEEEIARLLLATDPEGEIARRGVITAAMSAHQYARAVEMAHAYLADSSMSSALRSQLMSLCSAAEQETSSVLRAFVLVRPRARFRLLAA